MRFGCDVVFNGNRFGHAGQVGVVLLATILPLSAAAAVDLAHAPITAARAAPVRSAEFDAPSVPGATAPAPAVVAPLVATPDIDAAITSPHRLSATSDNAVPPANAALPPDGRATPWRLAGMGPQLPPGAPWRPRFAQIVVDTVSEPVVLQVMALGGLSLLVALFFRTRHRRRIGWGVLPDRSLPTRRDKR